MGGLGRLARQCVQLTLLEAGGAGRNCTSSTACDELHPPVPPLCRRCAAWPRWRWRTRSRSACSERCKRATRPPSSRPSRSTRRPCTPRPPPRYAGGPPAWARNRMCSLWPHTHSPNLPPLAPAAAGRRGGAWRARLQAGGLLRLQAGTPGCCRLLPAALLRADAPSGVVCSATASYDSLPTMAVLALSRRCRPTAPRTPTPSTASRCGRPTSRVRGWALREKREGGAL